jgi:hypothetical protein
MLQTRDKNEEFDTALALRLLFQKRFVGLAKILPELRVPTLTPALRQAVADYLASLPRNLLDYQVCLPGAKEPNAYWPIQFYQEALARFPTGKKSQAEARALFTAIHCYGERASGSCYNVDAGNEAQAVGSVNLATRKAWFKRLHSKYKATRFAKDTRIFW